MPTLYIDEFVGISNRFESLPLAFALQKAFGHRIVLDWHELDSFDVADTETAPIGWWQKLGLPRIRDCSIKQFEQLAKRSAVLRSLNGPDHLLAPIYLESAAKIRLKAALRDAIVACLSPHAGRHMVGVHIRHGDYILNHTECYRVAGVEWPAVPVWWYERTMAAIVARAPDTCFLLSSTGDPHSYLSLCKNFDVLTLNTPSPYTYKGSDHRSTVNPIADLFALACMPTLLATPISGYSHWAANVLGKPTQCIVPLPLATPDNPRCGVVNLYGQRLPVWRDAGRSGRHTTPLDAQWSALKLAGSAQLDWL